MKQLLFMVAASVALVGCGTDGNLDAPSGVDNATSATSQPDLDQPVDSGTDQPTVEPGVPGSIPEPRPPIEGNVEGHVNIDKTDMRVMESYPIQVAIDVSGEKPNRCYDVFWSVEDDGEVIDVEMISQMVTDDQCAEVVEPFTAFVPLGSWLDESRKVFLNGEFVGSFES